MPIIGMQGCLENPFARLRSFRFRSKRKSNFRFGPSYRSLCLSPNSVCSKRPPCKKYFYLLKSVQDIRRVLGVVYCWRLQICELSAIILVQLRNCSR
ncbi:HN1_G0030860.mRNA.1.CDS.1 [Saccharomyces cerevisiae]|nr:HN1_G0048550.mRNA.1.CDS.1 [Saccharomyces cerevisiae]CAD6605463.1 HN1_G0052250.mRNA.1.CDS.1 [Saccharomyces cerevisiae]CAD6619047.1 HN1_G0052300.mRNA.1.CDS.1 [Saccharomyces cerevisiae]CAD6623957.1 HN1_G0030900.mRNA.1.CDS.1 [Saccharomyces cerevisiae]CAD6630914.1 HN1_G0005870.mRNA.1.CDS.1 [Saccharomyces cerevisiae]